MELGGSGFHGGEKHYLFLTADLQLFLLLLKLQLLILKGSGVEKRLYDRGHDITAKQAHSSFKPCHGWHLYSD